MKKIAFLFLTLDNPHFPKIWNKYFKNNKDKYNIYIHPKYPDKLTCKKKCMIKNLKNTAWGFITEEYIELLKAAYLDKDNYKFITISESCIPIQSFDKFYNEVIKDPRSWIKTMRISKYDQESRLKVQWDNSLKCYKKLDNTNTKTNINTTKNPCLNFIKHYARFCLNRDHVKILLTKNLKFYHEMQVADEFFLSSLYPLKDYKDVEVTFDDWEWTEEQKNIIKDKIKKTSDEDKIKKLKLEFDNIAKSPKTIIDVEEDLEKIKKTKTFFYRKFGKTSNIEKYWNEIIKSHT